MIKGRLDKPEVYAAWSNNSYIRFNSTSGGVFSEFAIFIIEQGGYVSGAKYNDQCLVEHCIIDNIDGLDSIRQSKYLSSDPKNIYREIKTVLDSGKILCYCGSPCQIAGLNNYLEKEYDNLYTIDFICRGMNSPKAFKSWLKEEEKKENSKAKKVWFKYKSGGWKSSPRRTRIDFQDGHSVIKEGENNLYMYGYLSSNLYMRPSCGECYFKGIPRLSDVTLADFWRIDETLDDDKGTSLVMINSLKGRALFNEIKDKLEIHPRSFDEIIDGNPMFSESVYIPAESHDFLLDLDNMEFSKALKKYKSLPVQIKRRKKIENILRRIKNLCNR